MQAKDIAANIRANASKWGRNHYYNPEDGTYCVIGLKLMEQGIGVDKWKYRYLKMRIEALLVGIEMTHKEVISLIELQHLNDRSLNSGELIEKLEAQGDVDYPLEKLAKRLLHVEAILQEAHK